MFTTIFAFLALIGYFYVARYVLRVVLNVVLNVVRGRSTRTYTQGRQPCCTRR